LLVDYAALIHPTGTTYHVGWMRRTLRCALYLQHSQRAPLSTSIAIGGLRFAYPPYGYHIPRRVDEARITMPFVLAALSTCAVIHHIRYPGFIPGSYCEAGRVLSVPTPAGTSLCQPPDHRTNKANPQAHSPGRV